MGNFDRWCPNEHFCKIISKSVQPLRRICFKVIPIFNSVDHPVQWSRIVREILVEGHPMNMPVKLFLNPAIRLEDEVV